MSIPNVVYYGTSNFRKLDYHHRAKPNLQQTTSAFEDALPQRWQTLIRLGFEFFQRPELLRLSAMRVTVCA